MSNDIPGFIASKRSEQRIFYSQGGSTLATYTQLQNYVVPVWASMLFIMLLGGGGGGGGGRGSTITTIASGGGGGGSGGMTKVLVPTFLLPSVLTLQVGVGGQGGAGGTAANGSPAELGTGSFIGWQGANTGALTPYDQICNMFASGDGTDGRSTAIAATGGTATTGGVAGTLESQFVGGSSNMSGWGLWLGRAGQSGTNAGANGAAGTARACWAGGINVTSSGGAGGGGVNAGTTTTAGGAISTAGPITTAIAGGVAGGGQGSAGFFTNKPFFGTGGAGGGGNTGAASVGGKGGDGAYGSGGGGGGGANGIGSTGGKGGNGGDGLIVIVAW